MSIVLIDNNSKNIKDKLFEKFVSINNRKQLYYNFKIVNNKKLLEKLDIKNILERIAKKLYRSATTSNNFFAKYLNHFSSKQYNNIDDVYKDIGEMLNEFKKIKKESRFIYIKNELNELFIYNSIKSGLVYELYNNGDKVFFKELEKYGIDVDDLWNYRKNHFSQKSDKKLTALTLTNYIEKKYYNNPRVIENLQNIRILLIYKEKEVELNSFKLQLREYFDNNNLIKYDIINDYIMILQNNSLLVKEGKEKLLNLDIIKDIYLYLIDNNYKPEIEKSNIENILNYIKKYSNNQKLIDKIENIYNEIDNEKKLTI